jgi:hypothetical protein
VRSIAYSALERRHMCVGSQKVRSIARNYSEFPWHKAKVMATRATRGLRVDEGCA